MRARLRYSLFVITLITIAAPAFGSLGEDCEKLTIRQTVERVLAEFPEGDTITIDDMIFRREHLLAKGAFRNATWTDGIVPVRFESGLSTTQRQEIWDACAVWEQSAPVDFRDYAGDDNFIYVRDHSSENSSEVGMSGGPQDLNINAWGNQRVLIHELGHALGFMHEHQRTDRGQYVLIDYDNIPDDEEHNFVKLYDGSIYSDEYDWESIMHYHRRAFAIDTSANTITPKPDYATWETIMGTLPLPSALDATTLASRYTPAGIHRETLYAGSVSLDGRPASPQSEAFITPFDLDNDPATAADRSVSRVFSLTEGERARVHAADWAVAATEVQSASTWTGVKYEIVDGGSYTSTGTFNEPGRNVMRWLQTGTNTMRMALSGGVIVVDGADLYWEVTESRIDFGMVQAAWGDAHAVSSSNLDAWEHNWIHGRLYFDLDSVTVPGRLRLYNKGKLVDTVEHDEAYFSLDHNDLYESGFLAVQGDVDDGTRVQISNLRLEVQYYTGDPDLVVLRSFTPENPTVGDDVVTSLTFTNAGSNSAAFVEYDDRPLPVGASLVSGTPNGEITTILPGEVVNIDYTVNPSTSGEYVFDSRTVDYEDPAGYNFVAPLAATTLTVSAPVTGPVARFVAPGGDDGGTGSEHDPFATIMHAVTASASGDTVLMADGTYSGPGNHTIDPGGLDLVFRSESGNRADCIIDAGGNPGFWFHAGEADSCEVVSLTVINASSGVLVGDPAGDSPSAPILRDCVVRNSAIGVDVRDGGSTIDMDGCLLENNGTGFSISEEATGGLVANCRITGSTNNGVESSGTFTLAGGTKLTLSGCEVDANGGDGVVQGSLFGGTVVNDCDIHDNGGWGARSTASEDNGISITGGTIHTNGSGGIDTASSTWDSVSGCEIRNNTGPGILARNSVSLEVSGCGIFENASAGILIGSLSKESGGTEKQFVMRRVTGCLVRDNGSHGIDIRYLPQEMVVEQTTLASNAGNGIMLAAVGQSGSNLRATSCTIVGNIHGVFAGGDVPLEIDHSILAYNSESAISCAAGGTISVSCCLLDGYLAEQDLMCPGVIGNNDNIVADPEFCDPSSLDFRLADTSPALASNNPTCGQIGAHGAGSCTVPAQTCSVTPTTLNFGVSVGDLDPINEAYTITNTGAGYLVATEPAAGPEYSFSSPDPLTLAPGDTRQVSVAYQPSGRREPPQSGTIWDTIDPGVPCATLQSAVMGDYFYMLEVSPDTLWFNVSNPGDADTLGVILMNSAGGEAGMFVAVDPTGQFEFEAEPNGFMVQQGENPIDLIYTPSDTGNDTTSVLVRVDTDGSGGLLLDNMTVVCIGQGPTPPAGNRYVAPTGDDGNPGTVDLPLGTIQHAIDISAEGDTIVLLDGTYTGDGNRDLDFGGTNLVLSSLSGLSDNCIIDCQGSSTDPHFGFWFHSGEDTTSVIEGITVTGAYVEPPAFAAIMAGAGSYPNNVPGYLSSSVSLRNVRVVDNNCDGVACRYYQTYGPSIPVADCVIERNVGHGYQASHAYRAGVVTNSVFRDNRGAGYLYLGDGKSRIYDSVFDQNDGVGLGWMSYLDSGIRLDRCTANGNQVGISSTGPFNRLSLYDVEASDNDESGIVQSSFEAPPTLLVRCSVNGNGDHGLSWSSMAWGYPTTGTISESEFSNNGQDGIHTGVVLSALLTSVQITGNDRHGLNLSSSAPHHTPLSNSVRLVRTTIADNDSSAIHVDIPEALELIASSSSITRNFVSYSSAGSVIPVPSLHCTNIWNNTTGDWIPPFDDQASADYNLSINPLFCGTTGLEYYLQENSPLAAANNPCGTIGRYDTGCPAPILTCRELQSYLPPDCAYDPTMLNVDVTVEGVVYVAPAMYGDTSGGYLMDDTGGINFWRYEVPVGMSVGDRIRVTGPLWPYLGELHIGTYSFTTLETGLAPQPVELTISELIGDCSNTGSYVQVAGQVAALTADSFMLVDGVDQVEVRRNDYLGVDFAALAEGQAWAVRSPAFMENGTLYLKPPAQADIFPPTPPGPWTSILTGPTAQPGHSSAIAWGDFDGDGDDDAYVVRETSNDPNVLLVNDGAGNFTPCTPAVLASADAGTDAAWADYDNDGDLDLFLTNYDAPNALFENIGPGSPCWDFQPVLSGAITAGADSSVACAWLDLEDDGHLEIYISKENGENQMLSSLTGFTDVTPPGLVYASATQGVAWADPDLDMDSDLLMSVDTSNHVLFRQEAPGAFSPQSLSADISGQGCAWGDYDNDGYLDIYTTHWGPGNKLRRSIGGQSFVHVPDPDTENPGRGQASAWGDFDNDGYLDLFVANWGDANVLLRNEGGTGGFAPVAEPLMTGSGHSIGAAWNDIDGDGDLDLYVCNSGEPDLLLRNELANGNHWLKVRLQGYRGPATPLSSAGVMDAIVFAVAGQDTFVRQIEGSSGYASQQSPVLHFGLGSHTQVDRLMVYWPAELPNGAHHTTLLQDVPVDRTEVIVEPRFDPSTAPGEVELPATIVLHPCRPNPFNPMTSIRYELPRAASVRLAVYDPLGRLVRTLRAGETETAGRHEVIWQGRDDAGRSVAAGVYIYRLDAGGEVSTRSMTLVK